MHLRILKAFIGNLASVKISLLSVLCFHYYNSSSTYCYNRNNFKQMQFALDLFFFFAFLIVHLFYLLRLNCKLIY